MRILGLRIPCRTFFQNSVAAFRHSPRLQRPALTVLGSVLMALLTLFGRLRAQTAEPAAQPGAQSGVLPGVLPGAQGGAQSGTSGGVLPPALSPFGPPAGAMTYTLHSLVNTPTISPGALTLLELDGRFSQTVATGGGPTFAQWFADDAVALNNGKPPVQGRGNIAASATWKPADYQLTWLPQGASMGPSNDMGYTWGSYTGRARDRNGQTVTTAGRYITVWRKQTDGQWKIALEASADDAPASDTCCALPKP